MSITLYSLDSSFYKNRKIIKELFKWEKSIKAYCILLVFFKIDDVHSFSRVLNHDCKFIDYLSVYFILNILQYI